MNWSDEQFVKVYTRDTIDWVALGWEAQAVFLLLLRKVDRAGVLDLGNAGLQGLADLLRIPFEVFDRALQRLHQDGCVTRSHAMSQLVVPNFMEAQEAAQTDKQRKRESRARRRAAAKHPESQDTGHAVSRAVTLGHSDTRLDETRLDISPTPHGGVTAPSGSDPNEPPPASDPPPWMAAGSSSPVRDTRRREPSAYSQRTGPIPGSTPRDPCRGCGRRDGTLTAYNGPSDLLCPACLDARRAKDRPHTLEAKTAADALAEYRARLGRSAKPPEDAK